ncbi:MULTISPECIES: MarR family winged helix-turn-helix transcriptional regulator [unclassified Bacillus cereus group]|uniref:MarR family winged helix-turn-helix transcriptional regulator n=1 Tax=unclassified Bacillus cereus group TaxID=2750818 RepID=UPI001F5930CB|nr:MULTISPECIES: MarR family transcriptional regulator [unclassified Bacillus cereus group]
MDRMNNEDLSLKLFVIFSRAGQSITKRIEEDIKGYGIHPTEFAVLELLFNKGDQPIQKIGDKILLASSSITYVIDKLEKKQLLVRRPCSNDRRVTYAAITLEGIEFMKMIFPKHKKAIQQIFDGLSHEEQKMMIEQLKKLGYHAQSL